jgi:hypothetical protein
MVSLGVEEMPKASLAEPAENAEKTEPQGKILGVTLKL